MKDPISKNKVEVVEKDIPYQVPSGLQVHMDKHTHTHTHTRTQTDRQTDRHTHTHTLYKNSSQEAEDEFEGWLVYLCSSFHSVVATYNKFPFSVFNYAVYECFNWPLEVGG